MSSLGIRVEGVASQIGAMGGKTFCVEKNNLIRGLCIRYGASKDEAENAIYRSVKVGAVRIENGMVILNMQEETEIV